MLALQGRGGQVPHPSTFNLSEANLSEANLPGGQSEQTVIAYKACLFLTWIGILKFSMSRVMRVVLKDYADLRDRSYFFSNPRPTPGPTPGVK